MQQTPIIVWLRNDLRLEDNPALFYAAKQMCPVILLYIYSEDDQRPYPIGAAAKWWLHHSLKAFSKSIAEQLILRKGNVLDILLELAEKTKARAIFYNKRYSPHEISHDATYGKELLKKGLEFKAHDGNLLIEPSELLNQQGKPFQVYTPFYTAAMKFFDVKEPLSIPKELQFYSQNLASLSLDALDLLPKTEWTKGIQEAWNPGEEGAEKELSSFCKNNQASYAKDRDIPSVMGTSRLSPHLHFGEISIRKVYAKTWNNESYRRELYFREFAHSLLFHFPETPSKPLHARFLHFPWKKNEIFLQAWKKGLTGYPIVDAGMRELWQTGWMHNRVRMIVGSFLVKHLLISWHEGLKWFWDTLVDADLANNTFGWQWVAGCGADAAPYFRIFNPTLQGEKFDPEGLYVKKYVPELSLVPPKYIHKPWKMEASELKICGVELGKNYPHPIVDHDKARVYALDCFKKLSADSK